MQDTDQVPLNDENHRDTLQCESDRLRAQLEMCRHDLRQAQLELARARVIQESLEEQLHAAADPAKSDASPTRAKSAQQAAWTTRLRQRMRMPPSERAVQKDIRLLRDSGWFDTDWYLTEYPDVAQSEVEPIRHYLLFGAAEGRNPGPSFNTHAYLRDHPELVDRHVNPLVHYLRSGQEADK